MQNTVTRFSPEHHDRVTRVKNREKAPLHRCCYHLLFFVCDIIYSGGDDGNPPPPQQLEKHATRTRHDDCDAKSVAARARRTATGGRDGGAKPGFGLCRRRTGNLCRHHDDSEKYISTGTGKHSYYSYAKEKRHCNFKNVLL